MRSGLKVASLPKISGSGTKAVVVPRRLGAAPTVSSGEVATPREKLWR